MSPNIFSVLLCLRVHTNYSFSELETVIVLFIVYMMFFPSFFKVILFMLLGVGVSLGYPNFWVAYISYHKLNLRVLGNFHFPPFISKRKVFKVQSLLSVTTKQMLPLSHPYNQTKVCSQTVNCISKEN